jgi:hypothetical protein
MVSELGNFANVYRTKSEKAPVLLEAHPHVQFV